MKNIYQKKTKQNNNTINGTNETNKKRIRVISIFSWGLLCQCPCPHSQPQAIPASPGGPPVPLGRSLDLLWALWCQLRL